MPGTQTLAANKEGKRALAVLSPIPFNSLFLLAIVGIEHNTKLAAKISCNSPDFFDHMMRNYWAEQQKNNSYIQKEETEKLHFGHRSMKAQQKCKKSKQASKYRPLQNRDCQEKRPKVLSEQFSISLEKLEFKYFVRM